MPSYWLTARRTLNIGHRGASAAAPANTLAAFEQAAAMGADGVELDVHLSADGVPVVIHDFAVDATTDASGQVADLTLAALKELDAGSWFSPAFSGAQIPTLDEVFETVGQRLLINVELKVRDQSAALAQAVAAAVERHDLADRVLISSFEPRALQQMERVAPQLPLGFLTSPLPDAWLARIRLRLMRDLRTEAIHPHWRQLRAATVRRVHNRGQRIVVWTVDDAGAMQELAFWGVDAIITNRPDRLHEVLAPSGTRMNADQRG
jgi:glycerophosphoryl diester phosphodiesterase